MKTALPLWRRTSPVHRTPMSVGRLCVLVLLLLTLSSCSLLGFGSSDAPQPVRFSKVDGIGPEARVLELQISKRTLQDFLAKGDVINRARLIEVYRGPRGATEYPVWRLFDVKPGSIYQLLGLQTADIVVAAHDYVILAPDSFFGYLGLLPGFTESSMVVERGGSRIFLKYQITQ